MVKHLKLQVKNKLSQEATYIHTQATSYRLTVWANNVFLSGILLTDCILQFQRKGQLLYYLS